MSLSKQHIDTLTKPVSFDPDRLGRVLATGCPSIVFALLIGSARDGTVKSHSDLDLAVYLSDPPSLDLYDRLSARCGEVVPDVRCDIGILNHADPVYRYEALKGRLLFTRDRETWLRFYSIASREYEYQLFDYRRQERYRLAGRIKAGREIG